MMTTSSLCINGESMAKGKQVRLFLVDGTPSGILAAEIMNWTGRIFSGSRSDLNELLGRGEANSPGVYFLLGENPENPDRRRMYVGEADDVAARLRQHNSASIGKDFWDRVVFLTSKDANLTKAHVRFLESQLISMAVLADRFELENDKRPPIVNLPEADISDMEYFLRQAQIVLPILGVDAFRVRTLPSNKNVEAETNHASPVFEMKVPIEQGSAMGQDIDGEFVVAEGSHARSSWSGKSISYERLYRRLVESGTLARSGDRTVFMRDHAFNSPSAAAAIVAGRTSNGRTAWRNSTNGQTYAQWQEQLAPPLPDEN